MAVMKVNKESFETEVLKAEGMVLVDFFADWCGPCKMLSPIVDEVAEENTDIKVCKINVDEEPELAMRYNVMSIPTLVVIQNGEEVNKSVGLVSKEDIIKMVK
jgi:thioredoxin 1